MTWRGQFPVQRGMVIGKKSGLQENPGVCDAIVWLQGRLKLTAPHSPRNSSKPEPTEKAFIFISHRFPFDC